MSLSVVFLHVWISCTNKIQQYIFILRWLQPCFLCGNVTHFMGMQHSHILNARKIMVLLIEHQTHVTFLVTLTRSLDPKSWKLSRLRGAELRRWLMLLFRLDSHTYLYIYLYHVMLSSQGVL
jgi:hypothetical protein